MAAALVTFTAVRSNVNAVSAGSPLSRCTHPFGAVAPTGEARARSPEKARRLADSAATRPRAEAPTKGTLRPDSGVAND